MVVFCFSLHKHGNGPPSQRWVICHPVVFWMAVVHPHWVILRRWSEVEIEPTQFKYDHRWLGSRHEFLGNRLFDNIGSMVCWKAGG